MAYDMEFLGTEMDDMLPPEGADNSGDDLLQGAGGNDVLHGWMGDDTLMGGPGDDRLAGGPGGDNLDGGSGMDTADYTGSMDPVHVDLRTPFSLQDDDPAPVHGGDAEGDILTSIEHIWGSRGADTLIGNHVANILAGHYGDDKIAGGSGHDQLYGEAGHDLLRGNSGNDVLSGGMGVDDLAGGIGNDTLRGGDGDDALYGEEGNDVLEGGGGADILDGGSGSDDTAAYTMSDEGVTINLAHAQDASLLTPGPSGGDAQGDTLMDIENLRGSMDDDKLTGTPGANKLYGNQGDDMLMGAAGNDMLRGGKGDDELEGGAGNDTIRGDKGDDTLTGDDGADTFWLMKGDGDDTIEDFETGDTIKFGTLTQKLTASEIRDILDTEDENRDGTFTYEWEDVSVTVDRELEAGDFGTPGPSQSLTEGDDDWPGDFDVKTRVLRGPNVIHGLGGDDVISGDDGDDTLFGNAGDDRLMGDEDDDILSGGRGDDNLRGGDDMDVLLGGPGNDTLGGDRHNDELTGGSGGDKFWFGPRDGHDTITDFGTGSGDYISLGDRPRTMSEIDEVLDSLSVGDDGYTYDWEQTSFTVNRPLTEDDFEKEPEEPAAPPIMLDDGGDEWPGTGVSNDGDDMVYGGDGDDMIDGGAGNDMLKGMDGNDTIMGGDDDDMLTGGAGNDTFQFDADDGDDMITDFQTGDMIMLGAAAISMSEAEAVIASRMPISGGGHKYTWGKTTFSVQDDPLVMDDLVYELPAQATQLTSGPDSWGSATMTATDYNGGDDWVDGLAGMDTLMGGDGNDTLMGGDDDDTLMGGDDDDTLMGGDDDDTLMGEDDEDYLMGGAGNDTLTGGDDDDMLDGGAGYDDLDGGPGDDMVYADADDVSTLLADGSTTHEPDVMGGLGDDTLSFARSMAAINNGAARAPGDTANAAYAVDDTFENVIGSDYGDMLTVDSGRAAELPISLMGGDGNDTLTGGAGNDTIDGEGGADTIEGAAGNDMLNGGGGDDMLEGGVGNDTLDGGAGRDSLMGDDGADVFVWGDEDVVTDFDNTEDDEIDISALGVTRADIAFSQQGADTLVTIDVGGVDQHMVLEDVTATTGVGLTDFIL